MLLYVVVQVRIQTSMEYKGPTDCLRKIIKHEGFSRLFSGMLPPLATSSLINAIIFSTYGHVNKVLHDIGSDKASISNIYISGCVAGFTQTFIACPCELVKIKLQEKTEGKQSMTKVVKDIYRGQGFKGFFRGYESTFYRDTPAFGAYFLSYYLLMERLEKPLGSVMAAFIAGGAAGAISWGVIYPMDIVKTKIQMSSTDTPVKSTYAMVRDICRTNGVRALYRGCGTTIIRSFPVNAVLFPVYETCVLVLGEGKE